MNSLFSELLLQLDSTTSINQRQRYLVSYFMSANEEDHIWAVALLSGRKPKSPVSSAQLKLWAAELAEVPYWLFEESYHVVGDLAETISLIVPEGVQSEDRSLTQVMKELRHLLKAGDIEKKDFMFRYWKTLGRKECFAFTKLLTGGFRIGVSAQLVSKALAEVFKLEATEIAHRMMGNWLPENTSLTELLSDAGAQEKSVRPYPFYLAYPLEDELSSLGDPRHWQAEYKFDGIRGQIVRRENTFAIWSRGEELVTDRFPDLHEDILKLPADTVLDGELIGRKNEHLLPFQELQKRIGRKALSKKILEEVPMAFIVYDVLEYEGKDIRNESMQARREILSNIINPTKTENPYFNHFVISESLSFNTWEELATLRLGARDLACEGLMLKHKDSTYEVGRKRGSWWKWKLDPYSIDGVLLYAQSGHGRRANLYTDYTLAVWSGNELVPFAKAYSGLTDKELIEVDAFVKKNTIEKFGPVRSVKPQLVFEIAFEGIQASPRHKSGVALRFPRIVRWRKDKPVEEANTKEDLLELLKVVSGQ